jgi:hypothetical protein
VPEPSALEAKMLPPFGAGLVNSMVVLRVSAGATVDSTVECVSQRIRRLVSSSATKQAKEVAAPESFERQTFDNEIEGLIAVDALGQGRRHMIRDCGTFPTRLKSINILLKCEGWLVNQKLVTGLCREDWAFGATMIPNQRLHVRRASRSLSRAR